MKKPSCLFHSTWNVGRFSKVLSTDLFHQTQVVWQKSDLLCCSITPQHIIPNPSCGHTVPAIPTPAPNRAGIPCSRYSLKDKPLVMTNSTPLFPKSHHVSNCVHHDWKTFQEMECVLFLEVDCILLNRQIHRGDKAQIQKCNQTLECIGRKALWKNKLQCNYDQCSNICWREFLFTNRSSRNVEIWCKLHCVNPHFRSAVNIINVRSAVTEQAMDGQQCAVLGKVQTEPSKPQKNLSKQNLSKTPLCIRHWAALNPRMWWENPHAEVQEPKSTAQTQVWAGLPCSELDSTWTKC